MTLWSSSDLAVSSNFPFQEFINSGRRGERTQSMSGQPRKIRHTGPWRGFGICSRFALFIMRLSPPVGGYRQPGKAEPARARLYVLRVRRKVSHRRDVHVADCVPGGVITRGVAFKASTLGGRRAVRRRRRRRRLLLLLGWTDGEVAVRNSNRRIETSERVDTERERERESAERVPDANQIALYRATPLPHRCRACAAAARQHGVAARRGSVVRHSTREGEPSNGGGR